MTGRPFILQVPNRYWLPFVVCSLHKSTRHIWLIVVINSIVIVADVALVAVCLIFKTYLYGFAYSFMRHTFNIHLSRSLSFCLWLSLQMHNHICMDADLTAYFRIESNWEYIVRSVTQFYNQEWCKISVIIAIVTNF